jgi:hypothetical protein
VISDFLTLQGEPVTGDDRYFRVESATTAGHTATERAVMREHRWFAEHEIGGWDETIYPWTCPPFWARGRHRKGLATGRRRRPMGDAISGFGLVLGAIALVLAIKSFGINQEFQRGVVFRLGRLAGTRGRAGSG